MESYLKVITIVIVCCKLSETRPQHRSHLPNCRFLPLLTTQGRIGTCCILPGKHNRIFHDEVVVEEPERPPDEDSPPPVPSKPTCDVHPFFFRAKFVGKCCSFVGGKFFRLRSVLRPNVTSEVDIQEQENPGKHAISGTEPSVYLKTVEVKELISPKATEATENTLQTETTTAATEVKTEGAIPDISVRVFIDSSCREGYVLDSNYNCVEEF